MLDSITISYWAVFGFVCERKDAFGVTFVFEGLKFSVIRIGTAGEIR